MKKILATLAGVAALSLGLGACSAVDKEPKSIAPIAEAATVKPVALRDLNRLDYYGKANRSVTRPVKPVVSAHENHVNHVKQLAAAKAARVAKAKAEAHAKAVKAAKIAKAKAKVKVVKHKTVAKKTVKKYKKVVKEKISKAKKVSLSGIASCIAKYESGGNPRAQNPHSTASGLFQFIDGTWNHFGGYARAMYAPVSVQLKKFYIVWDGGRGAHNWVVAPKCGW